jgi:preprotein translocase subunit SecF
VRETLHRLYQGETEIDFIGRRRVWFIISAVVVIGCLAALFTRGLNYGIEFEGGVQITAEIPADGPLGDASELQVIEEVRSALQAATASDAQVQVVTEDGGRSVAVQTKEIADPEAQQEVVDTVSEAVGASPEQVDSQRIGSKWGAEVTDKAVQALVVFLVVILAFISWRFEWKMAIASIVALVHDLIITAGVYSLVGFEVTPSSVIAILTILGYSLYDTVVVFDKVEENTDQLAPVPRKPNVASGGEEGDARAESRLAEGLHSRHPGLPQRGNRLQGHNSASRGQESIYLHNRRDRPSL